MIQNVLTHIGGVEVYGVISIAIFFTCFLGVVVWAWRLKPSHVESMSALPLESGAIRPETQTAQNHE